MSDVPLAVEATYPLKSAHETGTLGDARISPQLSECVLGESDAIFSVEEALREQMEEFRKRSLASNTIRGYESDWRDFSSWCERKERSALPADVDTLSLYFVDCAQRLTNATLTRRIAAISRMHRTAGFDSPTGDARFRQMMAGVRRKRQKTQVTKRPLLATDLFEILAQLDDSTAQGLRDRALLVVGFTGALRRSELVALDYEDIRWTKEGMVLHIRSSKTDQEGQGSEVGIPLGRKPGTCPVRLLKAWMEFAGIKSGPIFRPIKKGGAIETCRLGDRSVALYSSQEKLRSANRGHSVGYDMKLSISE